MSNTKQYSEFFEKDMENFIKTLTKLTQTGQQCWTCKEYFPIILLEDESIEENKSYLSHNFTAETIFNGIVFKLELYENIYLPSEKGDITVSICYTNEYGLHIYDFSLSSLENYQHSSANSLKKNLADCPIIAFADAVIKAISNSDVVKSGFHDIYYFLLESPTWSSSSLVQLGRKLFQQHDAYSFHRTILNVPLRKQLYKKYNISKIGVDKSEGFK